MIDTIRTGDPCGKVFWHQKTLVTLLKQLQEPGKPLRAVEVGVFRGETSEYLLRELPDLYLWMVDPWQAAQEDDAWTKSGDRIAKLTQEEMDKVYDEAVRRTKFAVGRRFVHRFPSVIEAMNLTHATSPWDIYDLVFIDAEHTYGACRDDIEAWWPLVRQGGILSGHDYNHRRYKGVTQAVNEWSGANGLPVETHRGKVWVVRKP